MDKPLVGIIMGSDSDLSIMQDAAKVLEEFGVSFEITVISAHRTPKKAIEYAGSARGRGLKTIIAGAGGAAHLAGVMAAMTTLPVIGIPIQSKTLNGIDSLYSIVQMPSGVPVATVAINGAKNAGLLAIEILAANDAGLTKKLESHRKAMEEEVIKKGKSLKKIGAKEYLEKMES